MFDAEVPSSREQIGVTSEHCPTPLHRSSLIHSHPVVKCVDLLHQFVDYGAASPGTERMPRAVLPRTSKKKDVFALQGFVFSTQELILRESPAPPQQPHSLKPLPPPMPN
jgi:hypothetical protein